ncbi:MAG: hypothetical protein FWF71_04595 [Actinomycetia bacterium]|nr:hypothetical protein [Actinomycetes bacterium]
MSDKSAKAISFAGGLFFVALVVGFAIYRDERIRKTLADQLQELLDGASETIGQAQATISKLNGSGSDRHL